MKRAFMAAAILAALSSPVMATPPDNDFLVVVGSYPVRRTAEAVANSEEVEAAARACGYKVKHASSDSISGPKSWRGGRVIQYLGPYYAKSGAMPHLLRVKKCIPDAFLKEIWSAQDDE